MRDFQLDEDLLNIRVAAAEVVVVTFSVAANFKRIKENLKKKPLST